MAVSACTSQSLGHLLPQHLLEKLAAHGQGPVLWVKNWLRAGPAVLGNGGTSSWAGHSGVPMGSAPGQACSAYPSRSASGDGGCQSALTAPGWVGAWRCWRAGGSAEGLDRLDPWHEPSG